MQIQKHKYVTLDFSLTGNDGSLIGSSKVGKPLTYTHGTESILPKLEEALDGKSVGDRVQVSIAPDDAFGPRDESKVHLVDRELFDPEVEVKVGMNVTARGPEGQEFPALVVEIADDGITVDANHPLAGQTLDFDLKVLEVRDATPEELQQESGSTEDRAEKWSRR